MRVITLQAFRRMRAERDALMELARRLADRQRMPKHGRWFVYGFLAGQAVSVLLFIFGAS